MQLYSQKSGWRGLRSTAPCENGRASWQTRSFHGRCQRRKASSPVMSATTRRLGDRRAAGLQALDELQRGILGIPEIREHLQWPEAARCVERPRSDIRLVFDRGLRPPLASGPNNLKTDDCAGANRAGSAAGSVIDAIPRGYEAGSTGVATWMKWFVASPDA
jgi:hypothetical protein